MSRNPGDISYSLMSSNPVFFLLLNSASPMVSFSLGPLPVVDAK